MPNMLAHGVGGLGGVPPPKPILPVGERAPEVGIAQQTPLVPTNSLDRPEARGNTRPS